MRHTLALSLTLLLLPVLLAACATHPGAFPAQDSPSQGELRSAPVVEHWGAMRAVLRDGHTQGRVALAEVVGPHTIAVGALAGLAAEITIDAGTTHLAEVVDSGSAEGLHVRPPGPGDEATLLVLANVRDWTEHSLPEVRDLAALELSVHSIAEARGIDVSAPFPFRIEGTASALRLHVLDHSCPTANPEGPQPWTFSSTAEALVLIGFYAADSAGSLTHHGQRSHIHALLAAPDISGHLDGVSFSPGAQLFLPGT